MKIPHRPTLVLYNATNLISVYLACSDRIWWKTMLLDQFNSFPPHLDCELPKKSPARILLKHLAPETLLARDQQGRCAAHEAAEQGQEYLHSGNLTWHL